MKRIPLTRGLETIVDDDVYEWASKRSWYAFPGRKGNFYAVRMQRRRTVFLHNLIMQPKTGYTVDHIERSQTLDNRRQNLRICTRQQNNCNACAPAKRAPVHSIFKGLSWTPGLIKWRVRIQTNGESHHVGYFAEEIEAAKAYDVAARKHFGEFARLNFPREGEQHA